MVVVSEPQNNGVNFTTSEITSKVMPAIISNAIEADIALPSFFICIPVDVAQWQLLKIVVGR
jgi:hypothetical protein